MLRLWNNVVFLHWEYPQSVIAERLPAGLTLDCFREKAVLSVMAFTAHPVCCKRMPACVQGLLTMTAMCLHTYVLGPDGTPGVYFFSINSNRRLIGGMAHLIYSLPYRFAHLENSIDEAVGQYAYWGKSVSSGKKYALELRAHVKLDAPAKEAQEDPWDTFLLDRYAFFTVRAQTLYCARIEHTPCKAQEAIAESCHPNIFSLGGFKRPEHGPFRSCIIQRASIKIGVFSPCNMLEMCASPGSASAAGLSRVDPEK